MDKVRKISEVSQLTEESFHTERKSAVSNTDIGITEILFIYIL